MKYARFTGIDGKSAFRRDTNTQPTEGTVVESRLPIYMIDASDDHVRWAKRMFRERDDHDVLVLWEVFPNSKVGEGTDYMFDTKDEVYPEFTTYSLTYGRIIATCHRTRTVEDLSRIFRDAFNQAVDDGLDTTDAIVHARHTTLDVDFVRVDYHD